MSSVTFKIMILSLTQYSSGFVYILLQVASGHLAHRHYDEDGEEGEGGLTTAKKKRRVTRVDRPRGVAAQFRQTDVSGVEEVHVHVHIQLDICTCTRTYA